MQIQVNTDRHIHGREKLNAKISSAVDSALTRYSDHVTRVEVHLSDQNSSKKGGDNDMRCLMEARLEGRQPIAVTHDAATMIQAVNGALEKLNRKIGSDLGRLRDQRTRSKEPLPIAEDLSDLQGEAP